MSVTVYVRRKRILDRSWMPKDLLYLKGENSYFLITSLKHVQEQNSYIHVVVYIFTINSDMYETYILCVMRIHQCRFCVITYKL